ncbi:hypothetical protein [Siccirubricoccus sp. G192]|uniref:hypothetical protein n=1 Tax=Siccirubricoccus sp. G192 TaxID=2849651 RepID=UPI001C2C2732|nr:hypothetical protein [Siccirubricoccus sp. G192]MBV1796725.1 hypothetical protein [Siccirubricoccus sp. G192]
MNVVPVQKPAARPTQQLLLAAEVDQRELASGPLSHLVGYPGTDAAALLENCFPLLAVALSDGGEAAVARAAAGLARLRSVPTVPVMRLAGGSTPDAQLLAELLQGPLAAAMGTARSMLSELVMLRRERERLMAISARSRMPSWRSAARRSSPPSSSSRMSTRRTRNCPICWPIRA